MKHITIGTRASKLAMIQTQTIIKQLRQHWSNLEITIEQIHTKGDHVTDRPLTQIGGDGVFVAEIEHALLERRVDLAVHSLKDLPTTQPPGLRVLINGPREDVRDVFISRVAFEFAHDRLLPIIPDEQLEATLRVGTSSLRRTAQMLALFPQASILPIRGNVDTRLRKLEAGEYDGIVLAAAGLHRLGSSVQRDGRLTYLPLEAMMPAPGQGALALEMRDEPEIVDLLTPLQDRAVQAATSAERAFMRRLGAGCYLPVAAYAEIIDRMLILWGLVISLEGQQQVRVSECIPWTAKSAMTESEQLGVILAEKALAQGADEIIAGLDLTRTGSDQ